jgi:hypothetical protein
MKSPWLILINSQMMGGANEGQPGFTENAEFRVHLNRVMRDSVSSRLRRLEEYRGINLAFGD